MSKNLENEDETSSSADEEHILFITQFIKIQNEYREKVCFKEGGYTVTKWDLVSLAWSSRT
jgi:hypothetical protein